MLTCQNAIDSCSLNTNATSSAHLGLQPCADHDRATGEGVGPQVRCCRACWPACLPLAAAARRWAPGAWRADARRPPR